MRKADIVIGGCYAAKVSGSVVPVRIDCESQYGGWRATNLRTHREVHVRTAGRLRYALCPECYGFHSDTLACRDGKEPSHA